MKPENKENEKTFNSPKPPHFLTYREKKDANGETYYEQVITIPTIEFTKEEAIEMLQWAFDSQKEAAKNGSIN